MREKEREDWRNVLDIGFESVVREARRAQKTAVMRMAGERGQVTASCINSNRHLQYVTIVINSSICSTCTGWGQSCNGYLIGSYS